MDTDEQIRLGPAGDLGTAFERNELIPVTCHNHIDAVLCEGIAHSFRDMQDYIFFSYPGTADRTRIFSAMACIDYDLPESHDRSSDLEALNDLFFKISRDHDDIIHALGRAA